MSDRKLEPDVYSRASLIGWLLLQSPDKTYLAYWPDECLLSYWLRSIDPEAWWLPTDYLRNPFRYVVKGAVVDLVHFKDIAVGGPNTFGAALKRAVERGGKL